MAIAGDTLRGFIDHREWLRNPTEITFKATASGSTEQKFTPATSRYVQITGLEAFQSQDTRISMGSVDLSGLSHGPDTTSTRATVFLKVEYAGPKVTLLSYTDVVKTRFYLQEHKEGTPPQELVYRKYYAVGQQNQMATDPIYMNQLWASAIKNGVGTEDFLRKIKSTTYTAQNLLALVRHINGPEETKASPTAFAKKSRTRFVAGLWLNRTTMSQDSESKFADGATQQDSYLPKLTVGLDAFANPATQRLVIRTELSVTWANPSLRKEVSYTHSPITTLYTYEYSQLTASLNPQVLYNFFNSDKLKMYLAAGVVGTYAHYFKDRFTTVNYFSNDGTQTTTVADGYETPQTFWYSYSVRAGIVLFNKLDVAVLYTANDISTRPAYSINTQSTSLGVSYLFQRKKAQ